MASGRKQKTTNDLLMMKPGLRAQIPDSPSLSLPRGSPSPTHYLNVGYENTDNIKQQSHDYEDVERYTQIPAFPRKTNNAVYQESSIPPAIKIERHRQFTECSDDSTSSFMHSSSKDSLANKIVLGLILLMSLTALVLVMLMVFGVLNPKCGCAGNELVSVTKKQHLTQINQPSVSTSLLFRKINGLERNMSSLLAREVIMTSLVVKHQKEILELKSMAGLKESPKDESSTNTFKRNITTEVRQLREKQIQLDSSLNNLKESDKTKSTDIQEMSAKVIGLAVAVSFLGTNDSLIKSKVHDLSVSEVKFKSSLESLKQKDAQLDTSLQRAKSVEAFLNSSINQLKSVDGQLEMKVNLLNTTFMRKVNNISGMVSGMQGRAGPAGPPGPQGPSGIPGKPGAGNLSQCYHTQKKTENNSGPTADYSVCFVVPKNKVLVGATCSTIRGDETNLSSVTNSGGETVYSCQCKGESNVHNNSGKQKCFIDVWVCPRTS